MWSLNTLPNARDSSGGGVFGELVRLIAMSGMVSSADYLMRAR
jgi:hypothetical protein